MNTLYVESTADDTIVANQEVGNIGIKLTTPNLLKVRNFLRNHYRFRDNRIKRVGEISAIDLYQWVRENWPNRLAYQNPEGGTIRQGWNIRHFVRLLKWAQANGHIVPYEDRQETIYGAVDVTGGEADLD